jgi:vacuolar-type H+-ATPase subunit E/Vma4
MSLEALLARLERDAEARVAQIRAEGEARARACVEAASRRDSQRIDEALAERRAKRRARLERELAATRKALRAERLRAQHEFLDRVFARAAALAEESADDPRYLAALPRHLEEALAYLGTRAGELRCAPRLAPRLRELLAAHPQAVLAVDATLALGIEARARDGALRVDNTLAARLRRARARLEAELLARAGP